MWPLTALMIASFAIAATWDSDMAIKVGIMLLSKAIKHHENRMPSPRKMARGLLIGFLLFRNLFLKIMKSSLN